MFKQRALNFAEHLVVNAYINSFQSIGVAIILPILLFSPGLISFVLSLFLFGYMTFVFKQVYGESLFMSFLKSIAVYTIGNALHGLFTGLLIFVYFLLSKG